MEKFEIRENRIVYSFSKEEIANLAKFDEDMVEDLVLKLILGLKVRDGRLRIFHTEEVEFREEELTSS